MKKKKTTNNLVKKHRWKICFVFLHSLALCDFVIVRNCVRVWAKFRKLREIKKTRSRNDDIKYGGTSCLVSAICVGGNVKVNTFEFIRTGCISFRVVRRRERRGAERGSSGKEKYTATAGESRNTLPRNNRRGVSLTHRDTASCTAFREFSHPAHCAKRRSVARRARTLKLPACGSRGPNPPSIISLVRPLFMLRFYVPMISKKHHPNVHHYTRYK